MTSQIEEPRDPRFPNELKSGEIEELLPEEQFMYYIERKAKLSQFTKLQEKYMDIDINHLIFPPDAKTFNIENGTQLPEDTLLTLASRSSQYEVVNFLIEQGADKDTETIGRNTVYHIASFKNDEKLMYLLLKNDTGVNLSDFINDDNQTPFVISFEDHQNAKMCANMIVHGTRYNFFTKRRVFDVEKEKRRDRSRYELLHNICREANNSFMEILLHLGISPMYRDDEGNTILHHIISGCDLISRKPFIEFLAKKIGKFPLDFLNTENCYGETVLETCIFGARGKILDENTEIMKSIESDPSELPKKMELAKYLVKLGCNIHHLNSRTGRGMLHRAVTQEKQKICELLLGKELKYKVTTKDIFGNIALHYCIRHEKIYRLLIEKRGTDLNTVNNKDGNTPFHNILIRSPIQIVKLALNEKKINYKLKNRMKQNVFHLLSRYDKTCEKLEFVISKVPANQLKVLIEEKDIFGQTPLEVSIIQKNEKNSLLYYSKKANIYATGDVEPKKVEKNLILEACKRKLGEFIKTIVEKENIDNSDKLKEYLNKKNDEHDRTPLHIAVLNNDLLCVDVLLDTKICEINSIEKVTNCTPLMIACRNGFTDIALTLLKKGNALPNFSDNEGRTALHFSARNKNIEIIQILVENGGLINKKDESGRSPLHESAVSNNDFMIEYLIKRGAVIEEKDNQGMTPLHVAVQNNSIEATQQLIDLNADVKVMDNFGRSPLLISSQFKTPKCGKLIIQAEIKNSM